MGYRSDIAFEVRSFDLSQLRFLRRWAPDLFSTNDLHWDDELKDCHLYYSLRYKTEWIKWYENYKEVQQFEMIWRLAEKWKLNGQFVRVGEDTEDIETEFIGEGLDSVGFKRTVYTDW